MIIIIILLNILGRYVSQEIEDKCIQNGRNISDGGTIDDSLLSDDTCAFLMIGNPFVVIQPYNLQINQNAVIKLYSIERNDSSITKNLITKYDGKYPFNNLIFMAQTTKEFALVVVKNENSSIGNFTFKFRTNCYTEVILETYPIFSSPNLLYGDNSNSNYTCQYDISSTSGKAYSAKLLYFNVYNNIFTVNGNKIVTYGVSYPFFVKNATNTTNIIYQTFPSTPFQNKGFNASVQPIITNLRFVNRDESHLTGIVQVKFEDKWYYIQTLHPENEFSRYYNTYMSTYRPLDAHVMCKDAGFISVGEIISKVMTSTRKKFLLHTFNCRGNETQINQCTPVTINDIQYLRPYIIPVTVLRLTCIKNLQFKLSDGDFGYIQSSILGSWNNVCSQTEDKQLANNLCQQLGYSGTGIVLQRKIYQYAQLRVTSLGCENKTDINECPFIVKQNWNCVSLWITCKKSDQLTLVGGQYDNEGYITNNEVLACAENFDNDIATKVCQNIGYPGLISFSSSSSFNTSGYSIHPISCTTPTNDNDNVTCSFNLSDSCSSPELATVICQNVGLAGGNSSNEGRVEVYYAGKKGLLCSDVFSPKSGDVICKQLGFKLVVGFYKWASNIYGSGNGVMFLNGLNCFGNETSINQCPNFGWLNYICNKYSVVGLVCNGNTTSCGLNFVSSTQNVPDTGERAVPYRYPWNVYLYSDTINKTRCSGTIINSYWVLTSASCMNESSDKYFFEVGKYYLYYGATKYKVGKVVIHPDYSSITNDNNIALLRIENNNETIVYSNNVQPACLPPLNHTLQDLDCVTTGWNHGDKYQDQYLMNRRILIQSSSYCTKATEFSSDKMKRYLCSSNNLAQSSVFNGESGGPLTCTYNGRSTLVGIMDRQINETENVILFTKVKYYLGWINDTISETF